MATDATAPGNREPLFIRVRDVPVVKADCYLAFGTNDVKESLTHAKSTRTLANARRIILRPYIPDLPFAFQKVSLAFALARAAGLNVRLIQRLLSSDFVDVCNFKPVMERFAVPLTGTFTPRLWRRPFLSAVDASLWPAPGGSVISTRYAISETSVVAGVSTAGVPSVNIGAADAFGQTPITPQHAPDAGSIYEVTYTPAYLMEIQDSGGDDRTFPQPFREQRTITLLEC